MKYTSKLDKETKKKKELAEDTDYLKQVDNPESKGGGRIFIEQYEKDRERKENKVQADVKTDLQGKQQQKYTYRLKLAEYGLKQIEEAELPPTWGTYIVPTDGSRVRIFGRYFKSQEGILLILKSPKGNVYTRGIKTTNNPTYDVKAVDILVTQAENTIDSEKGILLSDRRGPRRTKSGIILPS